MWVLLGWPQAIQMGWLIPLVILVYDTETAESLSLTGTTGQVKTPELQGDHPVEEK